jgi:hypothetical protein
MTKTKERLTIGLLAACLVTFVVSVDALTRPVAMREIDTAALQQHSKAVFPITPESVIHHVGIAPGQSDTVEFGLRASRPGQSVLAASAGFEFHSGYPGPAYWASESSGPLYVTVMPLEPELVPEGDLACLISAEVQVKVCLPRGYLISRSA